MFVDQTKQGKTGILGETPIQSRGVAETNAAPYVGCPLR